MEPILLAIILAAIALIAMIVILTRSKHDVPEGKALIIGQIGKRPQVSFGPRLVLPIVHRAETIDITLKRIDIERRGSEGVICRDNIRADIRASFFIKVNQTEDDIIKVAQNIGPARATDPATLEELFGPKFSEALKTTFKRLDFEDLYNDRERVRDHTLEVIGSDLNGYLLEDLAIDHLEQTPIEHLDPNNILDAEGIRKITEIAAHKATETNRLKNQQKIEIQKQDLDAAQTIMELDRLRAEAEAAQAREIAIIEATEEARTLEARAQIQGLPEDEIEKIAREREEAMRRLLEESRAKTQALLKGE